MARVITSEPFDGWRTCGRPRIADPEHGELGALDEDCPSYESQPCLIVREEVQFTFGELNNGATTPQEQMVADVAERSSVRYLPADGEWGCPDCGHPMSAFTPEPRATYRTMSGQSPDEMRRMTLKQDRQAEESLSFAERQAKALEALVSQGQEAARLEALEAELAELRAMLPKPEAKPKAAAK